MIDIRKFLIGIFLLIFTSIFIYLIYFSFFIDHDIGLGFIALFGTFMIGGMSCIAFKDAFKDVIKNKEK